MLDHTWNPVPHQLLRLPRNLDRRFRSVALPGEDLTVQHLLEGLWRPNHSKDPHWPHLQQQGIFNHMHHILHAPKNNCTHFALLHQIHLPSDFMLHISMAPSFVCTLHIDTFQTASTHLNSLNKKNPSGIKGRSILALYLRRNFKSTSRR